MTEPRFVIVGGGHAAAQAAITLRQDGFAGSLVVVSEDPLSPYQRPPLSKAFLAAGEERAEPPPIRPPSVYEKLGVQIRTGVRATSLDPDARWVELDDASRLPYDKLLLATGSSARRLDLPGASDERVRYLRSAQDARALRQNLTPGSRLVVVGGGYLGLEVASVAARAQVRVTVLEAADSLLARVSGPEVATFFASVHAREGVDVHTGCGASGFSDAGGAGIVVMCADGTRHEADLVLVAIGAAPNVELAEAAGLECANGVVVDEAGRTSDPDVFAAGDCTNHPNAILDCRLRLESVHNAVEQAKVAATAMLGQATEYAQVPRFWSDQFGHKLQTVGVAAEHDDRILLRVGSDGFAVFYLRSDRLVAVDAVDAPPALTVGRRLIAERSAVDSHSLSEALGPAGAPG